MYNSNGYTGFMFERCLYFNVNALARTVNRIWDEAFAEFGLSPSHAYLLRLVLAEPGISPKQIGEELQLEKSTITRFLDALEKKGMVRRTSGAIEDARRLRVYPGRKAEKLAEALEAKGNELYRRMQQTIGDAELVSLVKALRDTRQAID